MKKTKITIKWLEKPESKDYPAASSYLRLIYENKAADKIVARLKIAPMTAFKSKDIFRAADLEMLPGSNFHVQADRAKIKAGKRVSPILLVREQNSGRVIIADGYHRLCAVYSFDEDASIPCRIV
jgi:hypothetical protein